MLVLKGFIVGIGKIIPGVSGSMLAITLGIYDDLLKRLSNIRGEINNKSFYLIKVGIGIVLAIVFTSKIVVKCLDIYYLPTMLLFIGMIIGGIPNLIKEINFSKKDIFVFVIVLCTLFFFFNISFSFIRVHSLYYGVLEFMKLICIGFVDAISSIVPGISGTALLMMFGYYDIIMNSFSSLFNPCFLFRNMFVMIPFLIGFIVGIFIVSKIITFLLDRYKKYTYIFIVLFTFFSVFILIKELNCSLNNFFKFIPFFIFGFIISRKIG